MFSIDLAGTVFVFFCFYSNIDFKLHVWIKDCCFSWDTSATCSWKSSRFFFSHGMVEMWQRESRLCWHPHSLSYATLQKLKQLFMASLGVVYWTEHLELVTPKTLSACIKYGKLGSMQNFQMGKSSSMCSRERDVNSIPEKVNDAQT